MRLLEGKSAIVTGAARGIGFAIAREMVLHGCSVLIGDIERSASQRAASLIADEFGGDNG